MKIIIHVLLFQQAGMCEVGRIKHHLKHSLWNPNNTILFVGYQAPGTLGRSIVDGATKVKIFGEEIAVNARIEYIEGYSGHADQEWLMNFIYSFITKPKHIFLVHGEPEGQLVLKQKIVDEAEIPVTIPEFGDVYELNDEIQMVDKLEMSDQNRFIRLEILQKLDNLEAEISEMKSIVKDEKLSADATDTEVIALKEKIRELENQIVKIIE